MSTFLFIYFFFDRERKKDGIVLTTDDFFIAENGQYKFDVAKLGEAHEFNQKRGKQSNELLTHLNMQNSTL